MRQPSDLRVVSGFPQRNRQGPAAQTNDQKDNKKCCQEDGKKDDQSVRSCKPLQHLLGLRIRSLGGALMDHADHVIAILCLINRYRHEEKDKKETKTKKSHERAHARALPAPQWGSALPIASDGPNRAGRKQDKKAQKRPRKRQHSSKSGQRHCRAAEILPFDSGPMDRTGRRCWKSSGWKRGRARHRCFRALRRTFGRSGNPDLRGAARRAKRDSFFKGAPTAIAIAFHIFKLQEQAGRWQTSGNVGGILKIRADVSMMLRREMTA
jgi:hypothetical protein